MRRFVFRLTMLSLAVLGPSAARADDQQIAEQIVQRLNVEKQAGNLKGFSIDLQVDEGTVWLSGRVANADQQAKALDIARRIPGVNQVVNDLSVAAQPAAAPLPVMMQPIVAQPVTASSRAIAAPTASPSPPPVLINPHVASNRESASPLAASQDSLIGSMGKALVSALPRSAAKEEHKEQEAKSVQPAIAAQDLAANSSVIGSGIDPSSKASIRQAVVQAAQPIANAPQPLSSATAPQAVSLEQLYGASTPQAAGQPMPIMVAVPVYAGSQMQVPVPMGPARTVGYTAMPEGAAGGPQPMYLPGSGVGVAPARYDHPTMPGYAWPSYAAYPNYAAVTYPKQYSATAWPYIGPFYPYPQVPLGWRKVTLEWDDGWWMLDFKDRRSMYNKH